MKRLLLILLLAAGPAYGQINNPPTSVNIVDATATGRDLMTAASPAAGRGVLGGTSFGGAIFAGTSASAKPTLIASILGFGTTNSLGFDSSLTNLWTATNAASAATAIGLGATDSVTFSNVTATGDATLNGVNNTMPNATNAASASSLMTRGLSDGRYFGFSGLQIVPAEFSRASQNLTNGGIIAAARGAIRFTSGITNGSGGSLTFADSRIFLTTQGQHTAYQGYGIYAINPQLGATNDTVFGIFYGSSPASGVPSFEPLSTNGYSVQLRNNGTNQLRYLYKNGTNEVSGPWTSLPTATSSSVQFAGVNTTNGFRVIYRRPTGLGVTDWTVLTNVAVSWTWALSNSAGAGFSAVAFIRTNTTSTNALLNDLGEFGFILGGENL